MLWLCLSMCVYMCGSSDLSALHQGLDGRDGYGPSGPKGLKVRNCLSPGYLCVYVGLDHIH